MKFAYLIMAHNNQKQLEILLRLLDYSENDIYLHIDKKNKDIDVDSLRNFVVNANLNIYKKYKVYHADISQTICQMFLLKKSLEKYHDFYHLLSGSDLPIKPHSYIVDFFENHKNKQFVHFEYDSYSCKNNCKYYYFFTPIAKRASSSILRKIAKMLETVSIEIQKSCDVCRKFHCGANCFSITHELASDLYAHKDQLLKKINWTISSDELILQTYIKEVSKKNYKFYSKNDGPYDYSSLKRHVDWRRGMPYVWRSSDYLELINSDYLFARKFDIDVDEKIVKDIAQYVCN